MARDIENKVVVVTGAARGIGYEIAVSFLKNGVKKVIILDVNEELGNKAAATLIKSYGDKIEFIKCDVTKDLDAVSTAIFDKNKTVDILVNNAGIVNEMDVRKTIAVNTVAVIEWSIKFKEHMRTDKGGQGGTIININSGYGFMIDQHLPIYKASKHAVMGFTRTIGHEYHFNKTSVRVVAICPGRTKTNVANEVEMPDEDDKEEFLKSRKRPNEMWQEAEVVGNAAVEVFMVADSGTAWLIQGGNPIEKVE